MKNILIILLLLTTPVIAQETLTPSQTRDLIIGIEKRSGWIWNEKEQALMLCFKLPQLPRLLCAKVPDDKMTRNIKNGSKVQM